jgi:hypothetical protein
MCTTHPTLYHCRHPKASHTHECSDIECDKVKIPGKSWVLEQDCRACRHCTEKEEQAKNPNGVTEPDEVENAAGSTVQKDEIDNGLPHREWEEAIMDDRPGQ